MIRYGRRTPLQSLSRIAVFLVLLFVALIAVYPIVFMGLSSFKQSIEYIKDPIGLPSSFRYTENYVAMYKKFTLPRLFLNTAICIFAAMAISLACSIPAAFAFAKLHFPYRGLLRTIMISTIIVPSITFVVPSYVQMSKWGLVDRYWSVILLWAATGTPGTIFLLSSLLRSIPDEILEAAKIDGAGYFETLARMVLPLCVPGLVTVTIFNVTTWWNDLLIPLIFLQSDERMTVTVGMATVLGRHSTDYPLLLTGLFLSSLPPLIVYILLQRTIRQGLVIGAVK
jgi:ABC-type glycerol-3-phosphate transport system permease component